MAVKSTARGDLRIEQPSSPSAVPPPLSPLGPRVRRWREDILPQDDVPGWDSAISPPFSVDHYGLKLAMVPVAALDSDATIVCLLNARPATPGSRRHTRSTTASSVGASGIADNYPIHVRSELDEAREAKSAAAIEWISPVTPQPSQNTCLPGVRTSLAFAPGFKFALDRAPDLHSKILLPDAVRQHIAGGTHACATTAAVATFVQNILHVLF
ncbi:hypothetical protein C8R46DRAFT_1230386 [Mycena filopes]|nr:hypothetical protein C8R46DRAFT_1230386 [Mycena filopes]